MAVGFREAEITTGETRERSRNSSRGDKGKIVKRLCMVSRAQTEVDKVIGVPRMDEEPTMMDPENRDR